MYLDTCFSLCNNINELDSQGTTGIGVLEWDEEEFMPF